MDNHKNYRNKISIIMPCYNAEKHIKKTVQNVLTQTYDNLELIIVNDGSTDNSLKILQTIKDKRIKIFSHPNQRVGKTRNRGIKEASGEYIAFLDSDDTWESAFLEKMHFALTNDPDAAIAYCGWQNLGLPGPRGLPYTPENYETSNKIEELLTSCRWPIHAALTRAKYIYDAGGFDERFPTSEDYWLWLVIACNNKIVRVPEVLAYYHFHDDQRSRYTANAHQAKKALNHRDLINSYLSQFPQIKSVLSKQAIRQFTDGELLRRGYVCYWERDLDSAHKIFRTIILSRFGQVKDLKYLLPAILPLKIYKKLITFRD